MTSTQRSTPAAAALLLLCFAIPLLQGSWSSACSTGCWTTSPVASLLITGISLFALVLVSLKFVNARLQTPEGLLLSFLLLFNPILGAVGSGLIAPIDIAGTAVATAVPALTIRNDNASEEDLLTGILLVGILLSLSPSFVPLVILPLLIAFGRTRRKGIAVLLFCAAVGAWLVPLILRTGSQMWLERAGNDVGVYISALNDASYGFPGLEGKRTAFLQSLLMEGLGGYHSEGGLLTILVLLGLAACFARGAWWMFHRETDGLVITVVCISIYIAWLMFNPNDIREARHVLPLIPLLLFPVWGGNVQLLYGSPPARIGAILFLIAYAVAGIIP